MMEAVRTSETSVDNHFTRQYNPKDSSDHRMMMDAVSTFETSVSFYHTKQRSIPEDS
jgi:hypothetical protein